MSKQLKATRAVQTRFASVAHSYEKHAFFQKEVNSRLLDKLHGIVITPKIILDLGAGTGEGYSMLCQRYPNAEVLALDVALPMLQHLENNHLISSWWGKKNRPNVSVCADAHHFRFPDKSIDLILSCLLFQWLSEPLRCLQEIQRILKPGGLVVFATLGIDTMKEIRYIFQNIDQFAHTLLFRDIHDWGADLVAAKLTHPILDIDEIIMCYNTVEEIMTDIKKTGTSHIAHERNARGLLTPRQWRRARDQYETLRSSEDQKLPLTYEVIYGHAWCTEINKVQSMKFYPRLHPSK